MPQTDIKKAIEAAEKLKDEGNALFGEGHFQEATKKYYKVIFSLKGLSPTDTVSIAALSPSISATAPTSAQKTVIQNFLSVCYSNIAACLIKQEKWDRALEACRNALIHDSENVKARFRQVQAWIFNGDADRAEEGLKELEKRAPKDPSVYREWQRVRQLKKEQEKKMKEQMRGFLDGSTTKLKQGF